jgi:hypothetical protein
MNRDEEDDEDALLEQYFSVFMDVFSRKDKAANDFKSIMMMI